MLLDPIYARLQTVKLRVPDLPVELLVDRRGSRRHICGLEESPFIGVRRKYALMLKDVRGLLLLKSSRCLHQTCLVQIHAIFNAVPRVEHTVLE